MGLFSSKSSSRSTTNLYDYSRNLSVDFSSGDLGAGSDNNIVATGDVYYAGMSDNLATEFMTQVNAGADRVVDAGLQLYNDTFGWIQDTIGGVAQQTDRITSALANAYNSEQATHSAFKTYALYGLVGFIAWAYFVKRK